MAHRLWTTRRAAIAGGLATIGGIALGQRPSELSPTGKMTIGPFYPLVRPLDQDGDLTLINGVKTAARGRVVHLTGRVLDTAGKPVANAKLELWQANAAGRYAHPADPNPAPLDDGFQGFGVQTTDAEGRYRFKTIKPGAYAIPESDLTRTPHLHFDVQGRATRIVTQMFFPGEALNAADIVLNDYRDQAPFIAKARPAPAGEADALGFDWDIVLLSG